MAPHGYACYSNLDLAMIGVTEPMLSPRMLSDISLIPVLTQPPSPQEIAARYFTAPGPASA
jgi:hypothetical protein